MHTAHCGPESGIDGNLYQIADLTPAAISAIHTCEAALKEITGQSIVLIAYQTPLS